MKKLYILFLVLFTHLAYAQVPQGIPYQAAARNASGQALVNTAVKVRFSILDSVATGTVVYKETHSTTTNTVGLFNVNVGMGTPVTGTFNAINWGKNAKFMQMELDITGTGSSYVDMGTQQMLSVPYALYAGAVASIVYSPANNNLTLGMNYGGGIIGYILQFGDPGYDPLIQHGIIVAAVDQSSGMPWGCTSTLAGTNGSQAYNIGSGQINTSIIVASCGSNTPAGICDALILNGYSDWFLPSAKDIETFGLKGILSPIGLAYWTSTESSISAAVGYPTNGIYGMTAKTALFAVRAIRYF